MYWNISFITELNRKRCGSSPSHFVETLRQLYKAEVEQVSDHKLSAAGEKLAISRAEMD